MSDPHHPIDEIQEALDGRLDAEGRRRVEEHLRSCAACRAEADQIEWMKRLLRQQTVEMPAALPGAIAAALDQVDRRVPRPRPVRKAPRLRIAVVASVAAILASLLLWRFAGPRDSLVTTLARDYDRHSVASPPLDRLTSDAPELERFFATQTIGFHTRVFDLGMMGHQLVGGRVHRVAGAPSALMLYQGPGGRSLLCQMFPGKVGDLGEPQDVRERGGIRFHVYHVGERTLVFWQEGEVVCVLISDGPSEEVINLAFAKALSV